MTKQKVMLIRVVLGGKGSDKAMAVEQKMKGDWGVLETLKQRAHDKLNKIFDKGGKNDRRI